MVKRFDSEWVENVYYSKFTIKVNYTFVFIFSNENFKDTYSEALFLFF